MYRLIPLTLLVALSLGGCGDESPVDAAGSYTIALTSRANGCAFDNWNEGDTSMGIGVTINQDGGNASATVMGVAATLLDLLQGGHVFTGEVRGDRLDLEIFGSNEINRDSCPHFVNSRLDATLDGDVLLGSLTYTIAGNGSPACEPFEGCASIQEFNGTRPPQ